MELQCSVFSGGHLKAQPLIHNIGIDLFGVQQKVLLLTFLLIERP